MVHRSVKVSKSQTDEQYLESKDFWLDERYWGSIYFEETFAGLAEGNGGGGLLH